MTCMASLTLVTSLITASYGFFGNFGASNTGVPPLVRSHLNPCGFSPKQRLQAFVRYVRAGHIHFAPAGAITAVFQLLTSYLTTTPQVRRITLAAGLVGLTLGPYTFRFLAHVNEELYALDAENRLENKGPESAEAKRCMQLIDEWSFWHRIREGIFGIVWALIVLAALSDKHQGG